MLAAFAASVSSATRNSLHDPVRVMPFANLEFPPGVRKRHGITGAKAARAPRGSSTHVLRQRNPAKRRTSEASATSGLGPSTQRITESDIAAGRIRVPRGQSKRLFPSHRARVLVELRGRTLHCRWDPRGGPPERSGVLSVPTAVLAAVGGVDEVLSLRKDDELVVVG